MEPEKPQYRWMCTYCETSRNSYDDPDFQMCHDNRHELIKIYPELWKEQENQSDKLQTPEGAIRVYKDWLLSNQAEYLLHSTPSQQLDLPPSTELNCILTLYHDSELQKIIKTALLEAIKELKGEEEAKHYKGLQFFAPVSTVMKMHELTPAFEGRSVSFNCMIYGMDEEKTYYTYAVFECPNDCGNMEEVRPDINKYIEVPKCNKCRKNMIINSEESKTELIQNILMEEPLDEAIKSSPAHRRGEITGNLVGKVFIGQKKLCTGIYRSVYNSKTGRNDITIDVHSMEDVEKQVDTLPTNEEIEQYKIESQKDDWINRLISSYTDKIGMANIKLSILLSLVGGCKTKKMDRGDINVIIMGDPSVAKSQLLMFGNRITAGSRFVSGHSATGAGVIGGVGEIDGRRMYMAGAMSHCSGSHLFLDELDKMGRDHMDKMHEAMEKQTISGDYVGINVTLPAKTPVIAGANPKNSTYSKGLTIQQNFNIKPSLQSRFDLKWLVLDNKSEDELAKIARYITRPQEESNECYLEPDKLASFIAYAKRLEPIFTDTASSIIEKFWIKAKKVKTEEGLAVDYRTLEALIRITFAFAKLRLHETVTDDDAERACTLMKESYLSFGQDILTGKTETPLENSSNMVKQRLMWEGLNALAKKSEDGYFEQEDAISVLIPIYGVEATMIFDKYHDKHRLLKGHDGRFKIGDG